MTIAIDPTICTRRSNHYVEVECEGRFARCMTVVDERMVVNDRDESIAVWWPLAKKGPPHISVCWEIDIKRWKKLLFSTLYAQ